jgi:hypothetical protein
VEVVEKISTGEITTKSPRGKNFSQKNSPALQFGTSNGYYYPEQGQLSEARKLEWFSRLEFQNKIKSPAIFHLRTFSGEYRYCAVTHYRMCSACGAKAQMFTELITYN